jgi:hypothetical protein
MGWPRWPDHHRLPLQQAFPWTRQKWYTINYAAYDHFHNIRPCTVSLQSKDDGLVPRWWMVMGVQPIPSQRQPKLIRLDSPSRAIRSPKWVMQYQEIAQ